MVECRPMRVKALITYLQAKAIQENYIMDVMHFSAFGMIETAKRPPRYSELIDKKTKHSDEVEEYDDVDVIAMFRNEGKLAR